MNFVDDSSDNVAWPPGTVRLEDFKGGETQGALIWQPQPSDDPNDPLNWVPWRKHWNFGLTCFYVLMVLVLIDAATPTWAPMNEQLGFSYETLNSSYAAGCAALAVGAMLLIPFAHKFGRRPIYIFSTVVQLGVSVWSAKLQTVADLMLVNVFSCGVGALAEVIVQMTIADIYFVHQRGTMNSLFVWASTVGGTLGPLAAGYITISQGWRWVWWWNAILFGVCLICFVFGYEETKYIVPESSRFSINQQQDQSPNTHQTHGIAKAKVTKTGHNHAGNSLQSASSDDRSQSKTDKNKILGPAPDVRSLEEGSISELYTVQINPNIPVKTYWQKLAFTNTTPGKWGSFVRHMYQPLIILFTNPAVFYMSLSYGVTVALQNVILNTYSLYLPGQPYNFSEDKVGLMSLAPFIGTTIGSFVVGPVSDWSIVWLAHRNKGIFEPEMRLWSMVPFLPLVPAGALMTGIGLGNGDSWILIAFGLALTRLGTTPVNTIAITYITDSYTDIIGDAMVAITFTRNVVSTIFVFALTPWINSVGIKWTLVSITLITSFVFFFVGIFIKWGKLFRIRGAERYRYFAAHQLDEKRI